MQSDAHLLPEKLHLILVAYGRRYLDALKDICIPNLISLWDEIPSELRENTILKIYTSAANASEIQSHFQQIKIPFEINHSIRTDEAGPYGGMNGAHRLAIREAWEQKAAMLFLFPDSIFCQGSFKNIFSIVQNGYRCIIGPSIRTAAEPVIPALKEKIQQHPQKHLSISPREAVALVTPHLHPICKNLFLDNWNRLTPPTYPFGIYKKISEDSFAVKTLLGHVVFAWPIKKSPDYRGTIEMEFIRRAFPDYKTIYAIRDSDEIFAFDYSPSEKSCAPTTYPSRLFQILHSLNNRDLHTDYHLRFALATSFIHAKNIEKQHLKSMQVFDSKINAMILASLFLRWIYSKATYIKSILSMLLMYPILIACRLINLLTGQGIIKKLAPNKNNYQNTP